MNLTPGFLAIALLFGATVAMVEVGRALGRRRRRLDGALENVSAMENAAFALLGLLMAFTFNGAATRFDVRRVQIVDESNALGTAWLRLDLLPADHQPEARRLFREYLDQRIAIYRTIPDMDRARAHIDSAAVLQARLWAAAVAGVQLQRDIVSTLVLPPLNDAFDMASTRMAAREMHPPAVIWGLLALLTMICCVLAGYDLSSDRRSWLHMLTLCLLLTAAIYVIVDFEYPRVGFIRLDGLDHLLVDLRASIH